MSFAYGIIALISLCMVGLCVATDKKRDIWLLLVCVSVSVCNLGYFMLSISGNLYSALTANRISYLGSVFLPFFMLMMVLRFCGIKCGKVPRILLAFIGFVMLAITTSPGILPIYYRTVDIRFVNGATRLVREYGPLHLLYYVYLFSYMISMIGAAFYAIAKRKIRSRSHTILLLFAVFCNVILWLAEQFLPRGFEWLSVSYIITECLILAIYHSMQQQKLIDERPRPASYTINLLLAMYLLLIANVIRVITQNATPVIYTVSQLVVLMTYIVILVSWAISVHDRIVNRIIRAYMIPIVVLMILWMLMRTLRHTIFFQVFPYCQWCWYAYYIAMILIPQVCLMAVQYIGKPENYRLSKRWYLMYIPSLVLIGGILTNDLHQQAFRFHMGYEAGWAIYQRAWLYYAAVVWIFSCSALMVAQIIKRCRIPQNHRIIWLPIAMVGLCVFYSILYAINTQLFGFIEITAALCFTVVAIWESSIKTGLIQSNTHYEELLKYSELGVAVVDDSYTVHYRSDDALPLSKELMQKAAENPVMLDNGIRVSCSKLHGGYTIRQEDLSQLLDILGELGELRAELKDSNAVSIQNYQTDKRLRALAEKNRLHDEIHRQTAHQINLLNTWLTKLINTDDAEEKHQLLRRIVVVGAYLKRRNNLILVGEQDTAIRAEELTLSIEEMVSNLELAGITCASAIQIDTDIPSAAMMKLLDFYEYVVENAFDGLQSLLARFFCRENNFYCCVDAVCTIDLTTLASQTISVSTEDENYYTLSYKAEG